MNGPYAQARRIKDIGLVLHKYYGIGEITAPNRRMRGEIFTVRVGIRCPFSVCNLSKLVYHSQKFLLFTKNLPRPRALLAEQYYVLTRFSGRTPDISGVDVSILARRCKKG